MTYYDFEHDVPVLERYGIQAGPGLANQGSVGSFTR